MQHIRGHMGFRSSHFVKNEDVTPMFSFSHFVKNEDATPMFSSDVFLGIISSAEER